MMATNSRQRISLERQGRIHELQFEQVNVENLRRIFQVNPSEAWLRDDVNGSVYLPQPDGSFNLQEAGVSSYASLTVEGPTALQSAVPRASLPPARSSLGGGITSLSSTPGPSTSGTQVSQSSTPPFRSVIAPKKSPSFNLKIIKAKMMKNGRKVDFKPVHQTFIELVETTANVDHILGVVQRKWGTNFVLVTQDGLKLEDAPGTQGLTFWKSPRRRIYAVLQDSDTSDEDDVSEPRPKTLLKTDRWTELMDKVDTIGNDIEEMKSFTKDSKTNLPIKLQNDIQEVFKCSICHSAPLKPPVIVAKCCKNIVGCEECVNTWYNGENAMIKTCPLCRAERGYADTMRLNSLDKFINTVSSILNPTAASALTNEQVLDE